VITKAALRELREFHSRVHACTQCFGAEGCDMETDPRRVDRQLPTSLIGCEVMLLGEALGPGTQRLSGLPYLQTDGTLRSTGRTLDTFLAGFGYTIQPDGDRQYAYSSDLVRCVPLLSPARKKLRSPTRQESTNCFPWLAIELPIVQPRVLVLLGAHATRAFFRVCLGMSVARLIDVVGGPYAARIGDVAFEAFAIQHPSPLASGSTRKEVYASVSSDIASTIATY